MYNPPKFFTLPHDHNKIIINTEQSNPVEKYRKNTINPEWKIKDSKTNSHQHKRWKLKKQVTEICKKYPKNP